jgi:VWFA-related protein
MLRTFTGDRCRTMFFACLAAVLGCAVPAAAQSLGKATLNYIEAAPSADRLSNRVSAYVTVSDVDNKPIPGLGQENFDVIEDGKPVTVETVSKATDAMAVILAIDTSGSMQARDKSGRTSMAAAKSAAVEFISRLDSGDRVALYTFNNEPELRLDFTTDHRLAMAEIDQIAARHMAATCLYDTVYAAIKKAAEIPKGRRALIVLTDGRDEKGKQACSRYTANDVIDAATTKTIRVPVYTLGAGPRVDERELGRMASFTGGRYLQAASMDELGGFFRALAGQLKNQYVINYRTRTPSGEHSLVMKVRYNQSAVQDEKSFWSPPLPVLKAPEVSFHPLGVTEPVSGTVYLKLAVAPDNTIKKVRYYVDAALKKELTASPFKNFQLDTDGLPGGFHIIRAEVIDTCGQSVSTEMTMNVKMPPPPPVKNPVEPVPSPEPADSGLNTVLVAVGVAVLLIIAALIGWSLLKREKPGCADAGGSVAAAPAGAIEEDDGDETLFMPDVETPLAGAAATLTVVESDSLATGKVFHFSGTARIGRTAKNDIDIPDKSVSRKHAEIYYENGAYHIRDLGSQNGLKVDEQRVSVGGMPLPCSARIRLGPQTVLEFAWQPTTGRGDEIDPDDCTMMNE